MKQENRHFDSWDAVQKAMPEEIKQNKKFWWVTCSLHGLAALSFLGIGIADLARVNDDYNLMLLLLLLFVVVVGCLISPLGVDRHVKIFPVSWDTFLDSENNNTKLCVPLDRRYVVLPVIILIMSIAFGAGSLFWQVAPSKSFLLDRETREVLPMPRFGFVDMDKYQTAAFRSDYSMGLEPPRVQRDRDRYRETVC